MKQFKKEFTVAIIYIFFWELGKPTANLFFI